MLELGYGDDVVGRLDPLFRDAVLSRPLLDIVMLVVAGSNVLPQVLQRLGRVEI
jgi:hypothetical protein